jgi:hypothetical protein
MFSDDGQNYDEPEFDTDPWSEANRRALLEPYRRFFSAMPRVERQNWTAVTISPIRLRFPIWRLRPGILEKAKDALKHQLAKPEICEIQSVFIFDICLRERREGLPGSDSVLVQQAWQCNFHGLCRFPHNSKKAVVFQEVLANYYFGTAAIQRQHAYYPIGFLEYALKNQRYPVRAVHYHCDGERVPERKHLLNGARRTELRKYLVADDVVPADLFVLHRLKQYRGGTIQTVRGRHDAD